MEYDVNKITTKDVNRIYQKAIEEKYGEHGSPDLFDVTTDTKIVTDYSEASGTYESYVDSEIGVDRKRPFETRGDTARLSAMRMFIGQTFGEDLQAFF